MIICKHPGPERRATVITLRTQTGDGTIFDTEGTDIASRFAYRVPPRPLRLSAPAKRHGTASAFPQFEDKVNGGGPQVLLRENGARATFDIAPLGAIGGDPRQVTFDAVGDVDQRIIRRSSPRPRPAPGHSFGV